MHRFTGLFRVLIVWCLGYLFAAQSLNAGDWPQILGPHRNGIADEEQIADSWPKSGPPTLWKRDVGEGYAGVAVAGGTAILFHRVGNNERIEAMDARSGHVVWKADFPTSFKTTFNPDNGPRCTPIIHKGRVYVFGAQGGLRCVDLKTGRKIWSRETHKEFRAQEGYFGAGSTPIIEDDKIIVNVGSRNQAGIVAFALESGKPVWKATNELASYSSPVAATIDGVRHVIFITRTKTISVDPKTGKVRFEFPFWKRGPTINGATPLVLDGNLFVSSHYGVGAVFAKIKKSNAETVWKSDDILSSHYMTPIAHEGFLYGIHGQERVDEPELRCFDPKTKKILWRQPGFAYGSMIKADGKLITLTTDGELILLKTDSTRYRELARVSVLDNTTRALPALSNGLIYIRDTNTLKCLDLK
jgi:outer membrane protein assembly factor BamB